MHTHFTLKTERPCVSFNTVQSGFLYAMSSSGRMFDKIRITYLDSNGAEQIEDLPAEYVGYTDGDGGAIMTFIAEIDCEYGELSSASFLSQSGRVLNTATFENAIISGKTLIEGRACFSLTSTGLTVINGEEFFKYLTGLSTATLTAQSFTGEACTFDASQAIPVERERLNIENYFYVEHGGITSPKIAFFSGETLVAVWKLQSKSILQYVLNLSGNKYYHDGDGAEIISVVGNAVSLSDVLTLKVAKGFAEGDAVSLPFNGNISQIKCSPNGEYMLVKSDGGVALLKRKNNGFCVIKAASPYLRNKNIKDFAISDGFAYLLSDTLIQTDLSTLKVASSVIKSGYSQVFAYNGGACLIRSDGFDSFAEGDLSSPVSSAQFNTATAHTDAETSTLTAVNGGAITQYIFSNGSFVQLSYGQEGDLSTQFRCARRGVASVVEGNIITQINLYTAAKQTFIFDGASKIILSPSGLLAFVFYQANAVLYSLSSGQRQIFSSTEITDCLLQNNVFLCDKRHFYSATDYGTLFEVASATAVSKVNAIIQRVSVPAGNLMFTLEAIL